MLGVYYGIKLITCLVSHADFLTEIKFACFIFSGGLSLSIEGPSKTEIKCNDNGDGTCTVSYIPTAPGEYNITVKFAGQHISGSPFTSKITCEYSNNAWFSIRRIHKKWLFFSFSN